MYINRTFKKKFSVHYKTILYQLFVVSLFTTHFYQIVISGGILRPYHFFMLIIVVLLVNYWGKLLNSRSAWALIAIWGSIFISAILSDNIMQALSTELSFILSSSIALAVALLSFSKKLSIETIEKDLYIATWLNVIFGLCQTQLSKIGIALALNSLQNQVIGVGVVPSFWEEANVFGDFMVMAFFFFLPFAIDEKKIGKYKLLLLMLILETILNVNRHSILVLIVTLFLILTALITWKLSRKLINFFVGLTSLSIMIIILISSGIIRLEKYAAYKITRIFDIGNYLSDASGGTRIDSMYQAFNLYLVGNGKVRLFGFGYGQIYGYYGGGIYGQLGFSDIANIIPGLGIIGSSVFAVAMIVIVFQKYNYYHKICTDHYLTKVYRGACYSMLGMLITCFISVELIYPFFWFIVGIFISLEKLSYRRNTEEVYAK